MSEYYPDVMVDIETTGLNPDRAAILQIAGVRFDLKNGRVDSKTFNQSLAIPLTRHWHEGTRDWWLRDKAELLERIMSNAQDPKLVLQRFSEWALWGSEGQTLHFWAKPTHFDYAFIRSYLTDFDVVNPFHFRMANDMNSFIRARYYPEDPPSFDEIEFDGDAHDALADVWHQLKILFAAYEGTK